MSEVSLDTPVLSIVMPAYNAGKYIGETLDSIFSQTYQNFEIIIVDDGSTDNTKDIVCDYNSPLIKYYYQENSGGGSAPRNLAISKARGEYIAFCDADDIWKPGHLEDSVRLLEERQDISFCFSNFYQIGENIPYAHKAWFSLAHVESYISKIPMKVIHDGIMVFNSPIYKELLLSNFIHTSSVVLRRSILEKFGGFRLDIPAGQDLELWLRLAKNKVCFGAIPATNVIYRVNQGSLSRNSKTLKSRLVMWKVLYNDSMGRTYRKIISKRLRDVYKQLSYENINFLKKVYFRIMAYVYR